MEPRLRDDDERVEVACADFVERPVSVARIEFVGEERIFGELPDPFRLAVAERDPVHQRMRLEQLRERTAETAEADKPDTDTHNRIPFL